MVKKWATKIEQWFNRLTLTFRFSSTFVIACMLFFISVLLTYNAMNQVRSETSQMTEKSELAVRLTKLEEVLNRKNIIIQDYILIQNPSDELSYNNAKGDFRNLARQIKAGLNKKNEASFQTVVQNNKKIDSTFTNQIIPAVKKGNQSNITYLTESTGVQRKNSLNALDKLRDNVLKERDAAVSKASAKMAATMKMLWLFALASILIGGILLFLISKSIKKRLNLLQKNLKIISDGKLNVEISANGEDEIGKMTHSVIAMKNRLKEMVSQIASYTEYLYDHQYQFNQTMEGTMKANHDVSLTMDELSSAYQDQEIHTGEIVNHVHSLQSNMKEAVAKGNNILSASEKISKDSQNGKSAIQQTEHLLEVTNQIMTETFQRVSHFNRKMMNMAKLIEMVGKVAKKTNLLSLNASIEATSAGEHGRGFQVIADEVRKLSQNVGKMMKEMDTIIHDAQFESKTVTSIMESGYEKLTDCVSMMKQSKFIYMEIEDRVNNIVEDMKVMDASLHDIHEKNTRITESINHIAGVTEEAAASSNEVSASMGQTNASIQDLHEDSKQINSKTKDLKGMIKQFVV